MSNYFYNSIWSTPHDIRNNFLTKINDFATGTILDRHVRRTVTKFHDINETLNTKRTSDVAINETIKNFRDKLKPDALVWGEDEIAHVVNNIWLHLQKDFLSQIESAGQMEPLKKQIARYCYAINNKFYDIVEDDRYNENVGVKVVAKTSIGVGQEISYLNMCMSKRLSKVEHDQLGELRTMYGFDYGSHWRKIVNVRVRSTKEQNLHERQQNANQEVRVLLVRMVRKVVRLEFFLFGSFFQ